MVRIVEYEPDTGYASNRASDKEVFGLQKILNLAFPTLSVPSDEFRTAFSVVGMFFRTAEPSKKRYFNSFCEDAREILVRQMRGPISNAAFLGACIAHGDVPWIAANPSAGVLLSVGLDKFSGIKARPFWREILSGARALPAPIVPAALRRAAGADAPKPTIFQASPLGGMHEVLDNKYVRF